MPLILQKQKDEEQEELFTHTTFTALTIFNKFDFLGGWVGFPFFGVPFHFSRTLIIPSGVKMSTFVEIISNRQLAVTAVATRSFTLLQFSFSLRLTACCCKYADLLRETLECFASEFHTDTPLKAQKVLALCFVLAVQLLIFRDVSPHHCMTMINGHNLC